MDERKSRTLTLSRETIAIPEGNDAPAEADSPTIGVDCGISHPAFFCESTFICVD